MEAMLGCVVTLIRISSCLLLCERVFVRTFTAGVSRVSLLLPFVAPLPFFPSFTPPRSGSPQCSTVCQWSSQYICLSHEDFLMFECSEQCSYSFELLADTGDLLSMKAGVPACRFQREIEGVWIALTSDSTVWKLVDGGNTNIHHLEPRLHRGCSYFHSPKSFCIRQPRGSMFRKNQAFIIKSIWFTFMLL